MLAVVLILAVLAAAAIMVIPRAAQRSRESALRTQLRELQGAVDRYQAERNQPPHGGCLYGMGGLGPADPDMAVWVQEGKRRLGDVAQLPYYVWTIDWYALLDGGYVRWWPDMQILGSRSADPLAAQHGGTGDVVYTLVLASPPDTPGDWTTYAYRVCALPLGQLGRSLNDTCKIVWALNEYCDVYGHPPTNSEIRDYASLRSVVSPWVKLPPSEADVPWRYSRYLSAYGFSLELTYSDATGKYTIVGTGGPDTYWIDVLPY
jgi:type II secretory pathway pseudopilin PulG